MGRMVGFVCGLVFLGLFAGCSTGSEGPQSEVSLEDWTQPGWMVETLAEREEYGSKLLECYKTNGVYGARMNFGRVSGSTPSTGDLELDEAQREINKKAMEKCGEEYPQPEGAIESAEIEYGRYVDLYNCFQVNDVEIGPMVSKDRWIEEFNKTINGPERGSIGVEFDPYSLISERESPYEINDPELLLTLQTNCIGTNWSIVIFGNWS